MSGGGLISLSSNSKATITGRLTQDQYKRDLTTSATTNEEVFNSSDPLYQLLLSRRLSYLDFG